MLHTNPSKVSYLSRLDALGLAISLLGVLAAWWVSIRVFDGVPHIEDEIAYVWQARVFAGGQVTLPSVKYDQEFLVPFVVNYNGVRFGKYPPGWPLVLAAGILLGGRAWVNPLLAGLGLWLTYCLGKRLFSPLVGVLAAGLMLTSPFFLMNSGSLLSHPLGMALTAGLSLAWLKAFEPAGPGRGRAAMAGAACLGFLALTRPFTALGVALPFALHGLYLLCRGRWEERLRLLGFALAAGLLAGLLFAWQYRVTGNALLNPYVLWWPYDIVGFGPGHGVAANGHTLAIAIDNIIVSLGAAWHDLFGWAGLSWLFLPFGDWAARRNGRAWLSGLGFPGLVLVYMAYWVGSWLYGPRYYYEGLPGLVLFSAAGAAWLAGWPTSPRADSATAGFAQAGRWRRLRSLGVTALLTGLVGFNLALYLPMRLQSMTGLYQINRAELQQFLEPGVQKMAPALVLVHTGHWMGYAAFLELESPDLSSPLIFAWSSGDEIDRRMAQDYKAQRRIFTYNAGEPGSLREITPP